MYRARITGVGLAVAALLLVLGAPAAQGAQVSMQPVCFSVTNPAGSQSTLYGQRYTSGRVAPDTPAIVLVHGIASSTANWDFTPSWSVARSLAAAGYVVISYDRLGYAKSSWFEQPGGGYSLTTSQHRNMLHELVGEVKSGGYSTTTGSDCSGTRRPSSLHNDRVVIIGHSAGGWIVAGYPGKYHDVAAMIQTDITGSSQAFGNSSGGSFTPDPAHPDYFQFFQTREDCESFNVYPPGAVPYVVNIACSPPFLDSPFGEIAALGEMFAENDTYISMIGPSIPVLLTSGDHDTTAPPDSAKADYDYYRQHCGCDVQQWIVPDTAHLFMVHKSLPSWISRVTGWLGSHGIAPPPRNK